MTYYIPALLTGSFFAKVFGFVTWGWLATAFIPLGFGVATMVLALLPTILIAGLTAAAVATAASSTK